MAAHEHITIARLYFEERLNRMGAAANRAQWPAWIEQFLLYNPTPNRERLSRAIQRMYGTLPDLHLAITAIAARGDEVDVYTTSEVLLPGTNRERLRIVERHTLRFAHNQIVEHYAPHPPRLELWDNTTGWTSIDADLPPDAPPLH